MSLTPSIRTNLIMVVRITDKVRVLPNYLHASRQTTSKLKVQPAGRRKQRRVSQLCPTSSSRPSAHVGCIRLPRVSLPEAWLALHRLLDMAPPPNFTGPHSRQRRQEGDVQQRAA